MSSVRPYLAFTTMASLTILKLFVIAYFIACVYGDVYNVSNSSQDYFLMSQREMQHKIKIYELNIAAVVARFADRLELIKFQQQNVLNEIQEVNRTLSPLQALSLVRKHCIQKYGSQLVTYENGEGMLKSCYDQAQNAANSLTSNAKGNLNSASSYVNNRWPQQAASCNVNANNVTKLEECYIRYVNSGIDYVNQYLSVVDTALDKSLYDASVICKTAVLCMFKVEKETLEIIGETTKSIEKCQNEFDSKSLAIGNSG